MDFLFGYGSIINNSSRQSTAQSSDTNASTSTTNNISVIAELLPQSLYERSWCFRSTTGFTALGLIKKENVTSTIEQNDAENKTVPVTFPNNPLYGVLFPVDIETLEKFDVREVGYTRVHIPNSLIRICEEYGDENIQEIAKQYTTLLNNYNHEKVCKVWAYIPEENKCLAPDKNHPILQSYIDICIRGCLEWGGIKFAQTFLFSTFGWNEFYLDDTPNSRRPWIHRKDYILIDDILKYAGEHIRFEERRHPEEYSSRHMFSMKGVWGVPLRNTSYIGRTKELEVLHEKVLSSENDFVSVVGMGGIGKSSLVAEYCHIHSLSTFGLIVWFRAESSQTIASDMRRFANEFGLLRQKVSINKGNTTTEEREEISYDDSRVIQEIHKAFIFARSKYLLVFDNVVDYVEIILNFLPKVQNNILHCLFTSRASNPTTKLSKILSLSSFNQQESLTFLRNSLWNIKKNLDDDFLKLADLLGYLPLALSMAVAYLNSSDSNIHEYIYRLTSTAAANTGNSTSTSSTDKIVVHMNGGMSDIQAVAASLNITLDRIEIDNPDSIRVLTMLGYLDPDSISKSLIYELLLADNTLLISSTSVTLMNEKKQHTDIISSYYVSDISMKYILIMLGTLIVLSDLLILRFCFAIIFIYVHHISSQISNEIINNPPILNHETSQQQSSQVSLLARVANKSSNCNNNNKYTRCDVDYIWTLLKTYSLLSMTSSINHNNINTTSPNNTMNNKCISAHGSIHRLQAAALRYRCETTQTLYNLQVIIRALEHHWKFKKSESSTWLESGEILPHFRAIHVYMFDCLQRQQPSENNSLFQSFLESCFTFTSLMIDAASYLSFVSSSFISAKLFLEKGLEILQIIQSQYNNLTITLSSSRTDLQIAEFHHELGKLHRYLAEWNKGEELLLAALLVREQSGHTKEVAASLHELGIIFLKKHHLNEAYKYLKQSLEIKQELGENSSSIAGTLHQLAIVNLGTGQLDEAQRMLSSALEIEVEKASRAATLQQLGRVYLRRGLINEAKEHFQHSLDIYLEIYGESARHINIASIYHQLGSAANLNHEFEQAKQYFQLALHLKESLFNEDHLEVAIELQALGQVELLLNNVDIAETLFEKCKNICSRILFLDMNQDVKNSDKHAPFNCLLFAMYSLRNIAKSKGETTKVSFWSKEAKRLKKEFATKLPETEYSSKEINTTDCDVFISQILTIRHDMRSLASSLLRNRDTLNIDIDQIKGNISEYMSRLVHIVKEMDSIELHDDLYLNVAERFLVALLPCVEIVELKELVKMLFMACDQLRSDCRDLNIVVEDKEL